MPTIVLNRNTTNPNIPTVPVPGFSDTFNRADGAMGSTPGGNKLWVADTGNWSIKSNMAAYDASKSYSYLTADALTPNGTLTAKIGTVQADTGSTAMGLTFRYTDANNFMRIYLRGGGANMAGITIRKDGVETPIFSVPGSVQAKAGSVVSVVGEGSKITVLIDGVVANTATTDLLTGNRHGLCGVSVGPDCRFDSASFVPA